MDSSAQALFRHHRCGEKIDCVYFEIDHMAPAASVAGAPSTAAPMAESPRLAATVRETSAPAVEADAWDYDIDFGEFDA